MFIPPWPFWAFVVVMVSIGLWVRYQAKLDDDLLGKINHMSFEGLVYYIEASLTNRPHQFFWSVAIRRAGMLYGKEESVELRGKFQILIRSTPEAWVLELMDTTEKLEELERTRPLRKLKVG